MKHFSVAKRPVIDLFRTCSDTCSGASSAVEVSPRTHGGTFKGSVDRSEETPETQRQSSAAAPTACPWLGDLLETCSGPVPQPVRTGWEGAPAFGWVQRSWDIVSEHRSASIGSERAIRRSQAGDPRNRQCLLIGLCRMGSGSGGCGRKDVLSGAWTGPHPPAPSPKNWARGSLSPDCSSSFPQRGRWPGVRGSMNGSEVWRRGTEPAPA
jgi:hypothetical protein